MILDQPPVWLILIAFLAVLGPLVFIHEMGHYLVGRWCGVGAETFAIGFGREIAGWTDKRGTRWKFGWLPLGGYVRFTGDMDPASMGKDLDKLEPAVRARSFHAKPVWKRFLIVLAGPFANFLLAILIFAGFFAAYGVPSTPSVVGSVLENSAAQRAGLQPGDRIVALAGREVETFRQLRSIAVLRPGETIPMEVQRGGVLSVVRIKLGETVEADRFGQRYRIGQLGVAPIPGRRFEQVPILQLIPEATRYTIEITRTTMDGLWQIITGRRPVSDMGGPLKMAQIAGQQAVMGPVEFIHIIALFSINLGFINLLPVPMLDGGHLLLYSVEAVRRRPLGERAQEWMFRGGFAALVTLMLFTTLNDLGSFGLWDRLSRLIG
jgi:regulator of sigma E protease